MIWGVERHKKGWAVFKQETTGFMRGFKTIICVRKTKDEAEAFASTKPTEARK